LVKGKPWTKEREKALIVMVQKRKPFDVIAAALGTTGESVRMKIRRLGLEVVDREKNQWSTTSSLPLPQELPSIENIMKRLSAALSGLEIPGIDKKEIVRLPATDFSDAIKSQRKSFQQAIQKKPIHAKLDSMI